MGIATCPFDLIVILCRGSLSAATQLTVIPLCEPSFLRSAFVMLVDFLGANSCAPITSFLPWGYIYLSLVSCTWFSPGYGPLMGRICSRVSQGGVDTSRVRIPLSGARLMALKLPFSFPCYCSELSRPDVSLGRRLCLAMSYFRRRPSLGDACLGRCLLGRCLSWATPHLGDASGGQPVDFPSWGPLRGPTMC